MARREVDKAINQWRHVRLQVERKNGGLHSVDFFVFLFPSVIKAEICRNHTEVDPVKSSTMAKKTNHCGVGAHGSANPPYFHPLVLISATESNM